MPSYEQVARGLSDHSTTNRYSYEKILATCKKGAAENSILTRTNKVTVSIKDSSSFYDILGSMGSGVYEYAAGADLSTILMPFQTTVNAASGLPGFYKTVPTTYQYVSGTINLMHVLPFDWNSSLTGVVIDRYVAPSGDALSSLISSDIYRSDVDRYRDIANTRGIGLRLPLMGVGWGFTLNGGDPWPSGNKSNSDSTTYPSGTKFFKGGLVKGTQVDPSDYIAAPIDFRYDKDRNVWTCGGAGLPPGQGRFKVLMLMDDQGLPGNPGWDWPRFHTSDGNS